MRKKMLQRIKWTKLAKIKKILQVQLKKKKKKKRKRKKNLLATKKR